MPETSHPIPFYAISTPRQVAAACSIAVVQPNLRPYVEKAALRLGVRTLPEWPAAIQLDSLLSDPERQRAIQAGHALPDGSLAIRDRAELKEAIGKVKAAKGDQSVARRHLIARAKALGAADLLPAEWGGPPRAPATRPSGEPVGLDASPAALFDPGRRRELDTVVRAVALSTGSDYPGALGALRGAWEDVRAEIGMGAVTLARVAERAGVRALDSLAQDINTLQSRDAEAVKMLDAATSALPARRVDGQGRVLVEQGFDLPHYRRDDEAQERDWLCARALDRGYESRETFDETNLAWAGAGLSLVRSLERPVEVAGAHRDAEGSVRALDAAIGAAEDAEGRKRALETVIGGARTLDTRPASSTDQQVRDQQVARTLGGLTARQLDAALDGYLRGGMSLEASVAQATSLHAGPAPAAEPTQEEDPRRVLDTHARALMAADESLTYLDALQAVTGVDLGPRLLAG